MTVSEKNTSGDETGDKEKSGKKSLGSTRLRGISEKIFKVFAVFRDNLRSIVMVMLAGLAAFLVSVLLGVPFSRIIEAWTAEAGDLSAVQKTIYGALVLDFPKIVAGVIFSFAFGKFMKIRAAAAGVGIVFVIYLVDLGLSYVIGSFELVWGNRYALMGRPLLAVLGGVSAAVTAAAAARSRRGKPGDSGSVEKKPQV